MARLHGIQSSLENTNQADLLERLLHKVLLPPVTSRFGWWKRSSSPKERLGRR